MTDVGNVTRPRGASFFARYEQTFPTLTPHEIDRLKRFGDLHHYKHDEALFLAGKPHHLLDPATDRAAADLIARYAASRDDLPLAVCPDGTVLKNPTETALAFALGMIGNRAHDKLYDVAVVGSGPAGLATAVYAA